MKKNINLENKNKLYYTSRSQNNSNKKNNHCRDNNSNGFIEQLSSFWDSNILENNPSTNNSLINIELNSESLDPNNFIYDKKDNFEDLIKKNKQLKELVIKANEKINNLIKTQKKIENNYILEKESILEQLEKIHKNYKLYANSHKYYITLETQLNELIENYNILNDNFLKVNKELESLQKSYILIFQKINSFIENNEQNESNYCFEFITKIKQELFEISNNFKYGMKKNSIPHSQKINKIENNKKFLSARNQSPINLNLYQKKIISNNNNFDINHNDLDNPVENYRNFNEKIYSNYNCRFFPNMKK